MEADKLRYAGESASRRIRRPIGVNSSPKASRLETQEEPVFQFEF